MVVAVGLRLPEKVPFVIIRLDKSSFSLALLSSSEAVIISAVVFVVTSEFFFEVHSTSSKVAAAAVSLVLSSTSSIVLHLHEQLSKVTLLQITSMKQLISITRSFTYLRI